MALVGAGAAAAVVVGVVLMNTIGTGGGNSKVGGLASAGGPTTTTASLRSTSAVGAEQSMVALHVVTSSGSGLECGVAVAEGGLIATTADAVLGASSMFATTASGRRWPARLIAMDTSSNIALLRISDDLPVPRFADDVEVTPGRQVMVVAVASSTNADGAVSVWEAATVDAVGAVVQGGRAAGMAGIATSAPVIPRQAGALLLESNGSVVGLLDKSGSWAGGRGAEVFLPAELVLGVSGDLAASGKVRHGWLDVDGHDAPTAAEPTGPRGALVVSVDPNGASASVLRNGDVIEAIGGAPIRSMAELRSRRYVLAPGRPVRLLVARNGTSTTVEVNLASSP
jgi:S1-C subfamily serine protease